MIRNLGYCGKERLAGFDGGWVSVAWWAGKGDRYLSMTHGTCACVSVCKQWLSVARTCSAPTLLLQHNKSSSTIVSIVFNHTLCNYSLWGLFCSVHTQRSPSIAVRALRKWRAHHIRGLRSLWLPLIFNNCYAWIKIRIIL